MCRAWAPCAEEERAEVTGEVRGPAFCPMECVLVERGLDFISMQGRITEAFQAGEWQDPIFILNRFLGSGEERYKSASKTLRRSPGRRGGEPGRGGSSKGQQEVSGFKGRGGGGGGTLGSH